MNRKIKTNDPICNLMLQNCSESGLINKDKPWMHRLRIIRLNLSEENRTAIKPIEEASKHGNIILNSMTKKIFLNTVLGEKIISEISRNLKVDRNVLENWIITILEKDVFGEGQLERLYNFSQGKV